MADSTNPQPVNPTPDTVPVGQTNVKPDSTREADPTEEINNSADPLLYPGAFIQPDPEETEQAVSTPPQQEQDEPNPYVELGSVRGIAAEPISMVPPAADGAAEETPKKTNAVRRSMEEMSKRPDWLPENWTIELRERGSGVTAGLIDRYYRDPAGHKFRSKNEVLHYLETGTRLKRKATSEAEAAGPSENLGSKKQKTPNSKRKKTKPLNFDFVHPPSQVSWVHCSSTKTWSAHVKGQPVPEKQQNDWSDAFAHVTQNVGIPGSS